MPDTVIDVAQLVAFINARLDEAEAAARAALDGPWIVRQLGRPELAAVLQDLEKTGSGIPIGQALAQFDGPYAVANAIHVARHDPAAVLRDVEAKRRILAEAQDYSPELEHGDNGEWAFECVLRLLAQPYDQHPDYQQEWAA